jgi:hypothetical protein
VNGNIETEETVSNNTVFEADSLEEPLESPPSSPTKKVNEYKIIEIKLPFQHEEKDGFVPIGSPLVQGESIHLAFTNNIEHVLPLLLVAPPQKKTSSTTPKPHGFLLFENRQGALTDGFSPFGEQHQIFVEKELGDTVYWAYLMLSGASAFFCSDYEIVEFENVKEKLAKSYLLCGLPFEKDGTTYQGVVKYDPTLYEVRKKQFIGSVLVTM